MIELSNERIDQILHWETPPKEEPTAILRGLYTRYMHLYEEYFADISKLNDDKIAELRAYNEETTSLLRHYYMDIPQDICEGLRKFEGEYSANLLGPKWHDFLFHSYHEFRERHENRDKDEKDARAAFSKEVLEAFYDVMDYIFREGFGTGSQTARSMGSAISELLFGKEK